MRWFTHFFDLLSKYLVVLIGILLFVPIMSLMEAPFDNIKVSNIVFIIIFIILANYVVGVMFPDWISTYLYVRLFLFTPLTKRESNIISFIFNGSLNGKWYTLKIIRNVEKKYRNDILLRLVYQITMKEDSLDTYIKNIKLNSIGLIIQEKMKNKIIPVKKHCAGEKSNEITDDLICYNKKLTDILQSIDYEEMPKKLLPITIN